MIVGLGTDIEDISRFERFKNNKNDPFIKKVFSMEEIEYCYKDNKISQHLAGKFCAKEACIKALKRKDLQFNQINILNNDDGSPYIKLENTSISYKLFVSISHTKNYATSTVIATEEVL